MLGVHEMCSTVTVLCCIQVVSVVVANHSFVIHGIMKFSGLAKLVVRVGRWEYIFRDTESGQNSTIAT